MAPRPRPDRRRRLCLAAVPCAGALALVGCGNVPLADIGPDLVDDAPLSLAVRAALDAAPETMHQRILVSQVSEDVVRLAGLVDTDATRQRAEQIAQRVPGVRSVANTLQVR